MNSSSSIQRIRNVSVWFDLPTLRNSLRRSLDAGLLTLLDYQRLGMLVAAVKATKKVKGDVIEFGTFKGGSAGVILQHLEKSKVLHVCDSFEGMPETSANDNFHRQGDFATTHVELVRQGLSKLAENFKMHVGFFSDTIPLMEEDKSLGFSLAHIDADLYQSILDALTFVYPRMPEGGVIIFDDYGSPTCLGAKKAVDEFFAGKPEAVVQLSDCQYGCVVGGGNAFEYLTNQLSLLGRFPTIARKIFAASSNSGSH